MGLPSSTLPARHGAGTASFIWPFPDWVALGAGGWGGLTGAEQVRGRDSATSPLHLQPLLQAEVASIACPPPMNVSLLLCRRRIRSRGRAPSNWDVSCGPSVVPGDGGGHVARSVPCPPPLGRPPGVRQDVSVFPGPSGAGGAGGEGLATGAASSPGPQGRVCPSQNTRWDPSGPFSPTVCQLQNA